MENLTFDEIVTINGGSQETYEAGQAAGQKARDFVDDLSVAYAIASVLIFCIFKVKI